jgi:hypothetical protein
MDPLQQLGGKLVGVLLFSTPKLRLKTMAILKQYCQATFRPVCKKSYGAESTILTFTTMKNLEPGVNLKSNIIYNILLLLGNKINALTCFCVVFLLKLSPISKINQVSRQPTFLVNVQGKFRAIRYGLKRGHQFHR